MTLRLERRDTPVQRKTMDFAFEVRAAGDEGQIEGYGSVFGVRDSYDDIVAPGAFRASLQEHRAAGTMPAMLWQHNADEPIGVWTDMEEDEKGLRVKGQIILETERGRGAYALAMRNGLRGLSIGFMSKAWSYDEKSGIRTVTEIDLWEVSLVTFPANGRALIDSVKARIDGAGLPKDAEEILREAGFSKADATAFVSRVMRMGVDRREAEIARSELNRATERLLKALTV